MRVRLRTNYAGPDGATQAGGVLDLPQARAEALIEAGAGVAVDVPPAPVIEAPAIDETATDDPPETTAGAPMRRGRRR